MGRGPRRSRPRRALGPTSREVVGYPGVPEPDRRHRHAPLTRRGRIIWWSALAGVVVAFVLLVILTR